MAGRDGDAGAVVIGEDAAVEDQRQAFEVAVGRAEVDGEDGGHGPVEAGLGVEGAGGRAVRRLVGAGGSASLGEDRPFSLPVTLLAMPDRKVLGYAETEVRGYLDRDIETVLPLVKGYDRLQAEALGQASSVELIRAVRRDFEWMST
ncbi:hypothetical protein PUR61_07550 [Streptomyces sp. BE20]|uniref:hypothetical protein n=1 Tax=Streptomyces sp. BE20 TaxID=3002525 RepID=UPI002E773CB4|nr:hypothetical protein [Streptomyces sp. BE20]MEE1822046.1 hypothetical protein [Streptomyces sp. BE20]